MGKLKYSEENLSLCHFVQHKSHTDMGKLRYSEENLSVSFCPT